MANLRDRYSDPYVRQIQERYQGDPRERPSAQSPIRAVGKMGLSFAFGMAKFMLAMGAVKIGAKIATNVAYPIFKRVLQKGVVGKQIIKGTDKIFGGLFKFRNDIRDKNLAKTQTELNLYGKWKSRWKAVEDVLIKNKGKQLPKIGKVDDYMFKRASHFYRDKLNSFFRKDAAYMGRLQGHMFTRINDFVGTSASIYAADKLLNLFRNDPVDERKTALWNLPGHLWDYAKYSAKLAPTYLGFRYLGPLFKLGKEYAQEGLIKGADMLQMPKYSPKLLTTLNKGIGEYLAPGLKGLSSMFGSLKSTAVSGGNNIFSRFLGLPLLNNPQRALSSASDAFRMRFVKERAAMRTVPIANDITFMMNELSKIKLGSDNAKHGKWLKSAVRQYNSHFSRDRYIERVFGMRRYALSDAEIRAAVQNMPNKRQHDFFYKQLRHLANKGVPLADKGVLRNAHGDMVDLRNIQPAKMFKNTVEYLTDMIRIPGTSVSIPGLFWTRDLYRQKPPVKTLTQGEYELGAYLPRFKEGPGWNIKKAINSLSKMVEHNEKISGIYQPGLNDDMGLYVAGKWYSYTKKAGSAGKGEIVHLVPDDVNITLAKAGASSGFSRVIRNLAGQNRLQSGDRNLFIQEYGPVLGKILYGLDISRFGESIFGKARSVVGKFFHGNSPLRLDELRANAVSSEGSASRVAYWDTLNFLNARNRGYMSSQFKAQSHVLEAMGVDIFASDEAIYKQVSHKLAHPLKDTNRAYKALIKRFQIGRAMEDLDDGLGIHNLDRTFTHAGGFDTLTYRQQFMEFLAADNMLRQGKRGANIQNFNALINKLKNADNPITEQLESSLRIWMADISAPDMFRRQPHTHLTQDFINSVARYYRPYQKDLQRSARTLFQSGIRLLAPAQPWHQSVLHNVEYPGTSTTDYVAVPRKNVTHGVIDSNLLKTGKNDMTQWKYHHSGGPPVGMMDVMLGRIGDRFNRLFDFFGLGLDPSRYWGKGPYSFMGSGIFTKRVLPVSMAIGAGWAVDKAIDANPLFEGTALDEGLGTYVAEQGVKARMLAGHVYDTFGITNAAKYASGLMPGAVNSPLMRMLRGFVLPLYAGAYMGTTMGGPAGGGLGLLTGAGLGVMQGFGAFDLTKTTEELRDIYSGREYVPVRKGRWWELSSSNYQGSQIMAMRPNWFARMKAKHKNTPDGLGSPIEQLMYQDIPMLDFNPLGWLVGGGDHYAYKKYYSYPFPETDVPFKEMPFIGPTLSGTLGRLIKPPRLMHTQELKQALGNGYPTPMNRSFIPDGVDDGMFNTERVGEPYIRGANPIKASDGRELIDNQIYNATEALGLLGWGAESISNLTAGKGSPFESARVLGHAGDITSFRRSYWDLQIGGGLGSTELFRRFVPRRKYSKSVNIFNPLMNTMPSWMPDRFHVGSPTNQIVDADFRLPGGGFESARDVKFSFPVHAETLGLTVPDSVRQMLGMYPKTRSARETNLERRNAENKVASLVYDPYYNISASYDGVIRAGRKQIVNKIKELSDDELANFSGATEHDMSEVNFILRMKGAPAGLLQYQWRGRPIAMRGIKYSERRWERDIINLSKARSMAQQLRASGVGFGGESYSHIDRLKVLADVSPGSTSYKLEEKIVRAQMAAGYDLQEEFDKISRIKKARFMREEVFPYRFNMDQMLTPDVETNIMSLNTNIKAAAEYSFPERLLGMAWEQFSHMQTPLHSKFLHIRSPREAYERGSLYGRNLKMWSHPIDHFMDAYRRGFMSKRTPFEGSIAGATAGLVLGGPGFGTAAGALMGAAYGGVHGVYRKIVGDTYIPGTINAARGINRYFDKLQYQKMMMMYAGSGDRAYLDEAKSTMTGLASTDPSKSSWVNMYRATPPQEKPYLFSLMNVTDVREREEIAQLVPSEVANTLKVGWARQDGIRIGHLVSNANVNYPTPGPDWMGWDPNIEINDVKVKTIDREGLQAHDFGLGWEDQRRRMENNPYVPGPIDMSDVHQEAYNTTQTENMADLRRSIELALSRAGIKGSEVIMVPNYSRNVLRIVSK